MNKYYVHKKEDEQGDHEVHKSDCSYIDIVENFIYLGSFENCDKAVQAARRHYSQVNGCIRCSEECNTS
jgi:hypothetical protein